MTEIYHTIPYPFSEDIRWYHVYCNNCADYSSIFKNSVQFVNVYNSYNQDLYHLNLRRQPMLSIVSVGEKFVNWTGSMSDQNCVLAALPESLECHAFTSCT